MADISCLREPGIVAFAKTFGASLGILGAAVAWLLNKLLGWFVWEGERLLERFEALKALRAEIADNLRSEKAYANPEVGRKFIASLKAKLASDAPLSPYVAVYEDDRVFEETAKSLRKLPLDVIDSVVSYYSASAGLTRQLVDFRSDAFLALSRERQEAVVADTYEEGKTVVELGEAALAKVRENLEEFRFGAVWACAAALFGMALIAYAAVAPFADAVHAISGAVEWASACDPSASKTTNMK